jgi:hypothetical protein
VVTKLTLLLLNIKTHHQLVGLCNYFASKTKIKNVLNENTKKIGEEGKELLTRKLKHLKITMSEQVVNELPNSKQV